MNNRHWEYASEPIAAVYRAHAERQKVCNPDLWKPGGHLRIVLEDMELTTEVVESALESAEKPAYGLPCPECISAAKALLELDEAGRFYAIQHHHFPNSALSYGDWLAISESETLPPGPAWSHD